MNTIINLDKLESIEGLIFAIIWLVSSICGVVICIANDKINNKG